MRYRMPNWCLSMILLGLFCPGSWGGTYQLITGLNVTGEAIAPDANGVVIKLTATTFSDRIHWTNFTELALKKMAEDDPKVKPFVAPYILDEPDMPAQVKKRPEIKPKSVPRVARPDPQAGLGALFSSTLGWVLLGVLYLANLYAGYQIGLLRRYNLILICGASALLPLLGPLVFLCLPSSFGSAASGEQEAVAAEEQAYAETAAQGAAGAAAEAAPASPPPATTGKRPAAPTVYERGQFTFNRRFFETKLAGFLRVVPSEAERDMVVCFESARGRYVGNRIVRIMPNEVCLQVTKGGASSEVSIPFNDIKSVTVRHKEG